MYAEIPSTTPALANKRKPRTLRTVRGVIILDRQLCDYVLRMVMRRSIRGEVGKLVLWMPSYPLQIYASTQAYYCLLQ
jgi:hypothetical protein